MAFMCRPFSTTTKVIVASHVNRTANPHADAQIDYYLHYWSALNDSFGNYNYEIHQLDFVFNATWVGFSFFCYV
jgi:hypothetical protein